MSDSPLSVSRRQFVRLAGVAGALSLIGGRAATAVGLASGVALIAPVVALASGTPFSNGIDASTYTGGDGSYARYVKDGIKLGLIAGGQPHTNRVKHVTSRVRGGSDQRLKLRTEEFNGTIASGADDVVMLEAIWLVP